MKRNVKEEFIKWLKNCPKNVGVYFDEHRKDDDNFGKQVFFYTITIESDSLSEEDIKEICNLKGYVV